mmetsp:Transcript_120159/g.340109  ORF Transcript_120159/g.340109 Transcript_120159/m.340109 type:complete len:493 (+) Transcript_120159:134-1612(+)|eukprot:CAMPEP_0117495438 /NCGR_PEP_ID=MMETSP0784-20121206/20133_1 /TAXON_ID=39447 /ORGANISM="" /LENGTH=492 /DNA_ID=CAMNT_0005290361 /DNA_START=127 /DNA_END=1605 /DNA_ORIENTATION=-
MTAAKPGEGHATCLSDFKQLARLGEGAFSVVYKVQRLADNGIYALKMVKLPSLKDKEKQNALNEVRLLASVQHEHIIAYKEAFFDEKFRCLCIVTEFADKGDLFQQIAKCQKERSRLPENSVWCYLSGMCRGLKALHDKKILHRDLKCANVFLTASPNGYVAKLGDFNVSKVMKRGLCVTQTGTPYYASPEVWRDMPYDAKSDMWSVGCVLYEMLALRPPFQAEDMEGLYRKVLRGQYPKIPQQYSSDMAEVVAALLQVNPRNRPSVDQLLQMPAFSRHINATNEPNSVPCDLLQTIKLPSNAIDLSGCLPKARYELPSVRDDELPADVGSDGHSPVQRGTYTQRASMRGPAGGDRGLVHNQGEALAPIPDSLDAYMLQQPRPPPPPPMRVKDPDSDSEILETHRNTRQVRNYRQVRGGPETPAGGSLAAPSLPAPSIAVSGSYRAPPLSVHQRQDHPVREQRRGSSHKQPTANVEAPTVKNRGLRLPRIFG